MPLLSIIATPLLFVLTAYWQLKTETIIYHQKDNKQGYASLEGTRKKYRDLTSIVYCLMGILVGLNLSFKMIVPIVFGRIVYWVLFDGWYAVKVQHRSFWSVGFTSKLDRFIKTEKRSRLFKLGLLIISLVGYVVNASV